MGLREDIIEPVWSEGSVMSSKEVDILDADINMNDAWDGWDDLALEGPDFKCPHSSNEESDSDI